MTYILNLLAVFGYYVIIRFLPFSRKSKNSIFALIVTIHAVLFRALAYPYNFKDTENYAFAFGKIMFYDLKTAALTINDFTGWGQGYVVLNWLTSRSTTDPNILFVVLAVLTVGLTMWFYVKASHSLLLTVLMYALHPMLYLMGFAVVRQHLSIAFMLMALYFIKDYKKSIPFAILSSLFHYAGVVFLPYYFWRNLELKNVVVSKVFWVIFLGVFVLRAVYGSFISAMFDIGITRYSRFGDEGDSSNLIPVIVIGGVLVMFIMGDVFAKCKGRDIEIVKFITYGFMISLFCIGLSGGGRLTLYFIYVVPVAITLLLKYSPKLKDVNYVFIVLMIAIFYRQFSIMMNNWVLTYNYRFFWEY